MKYMVKFYLNDCNVKEGTAEANGNGSGSHDSWTGEKPNGHGKCCNRVAASDDFRLESHEQTCHQNNKN